MLLSFMRSFAKDRSGASAAEYTLLLGVIGTGFALASFNLGQAIATSLERSATLFASNEEPAAPAAAAMAPAAAGDAGEDAGPASDSVPDTGAAEDSGVAGDTASGNGYNPKKGNAPDKAKNGNNGNANGSKK